jgi:hypothetical protein
MKTSARQHALALAACLAIGPAAFAGSTYFNAGQTYLGLSNSPFAGAAGTHVVENFENGTINSLIKATGGSIKGPSASTDSVDNGNSGHSYSTTGKSITFRFSAQDGGRPSMAGLAWTDGRANSTITVKAWDAAGNLVGKIRARLGDLVRNGTTGEDRFFGISSEDGIARMTISSDKRGFEVDHVQFVYGFSVVPVPPAIGLGLAGMAALGLWRRVTGKKKA